MSVRIKLVRPSQVKLLVGFQPNLTGVISSIRSCAHHWHIPLRCTKWLPELKIEKSCLAFTGQTTGGISTKFYRSDKYHPYLCMSPTSSAPLNKMAARAKNRKNLVQPSHVKLLLGFQPYFTGLIRTIPSCACHWHLILR
jgi:hypothetical protein